MNIVFFGTPEFSVIILERLVEAGLKPVAVVTTPDELVGRKQILTPPLAKVAALEYGVPVLQPENLLTISNQLSAMSPDLFVVASYGKILPKSVLDIPKFGCLNVHPSLLPKYRGPSPIQFTILNGEAETGVTIMLMDEKVDHGPILGQNKFLISVPSGHLQPEDNFSPFGGSPAGRQFSNGLGKPTTPELRMALAEIGGDMLVDIIPRWVQGEIQAMPQDHSQATFTKILLKDDGRIDWNNSAEYIDRQVRAFAPWPGTFTFFRERQSSLPDPQRLRIIQANATLAVNVFQKEPPGTVLRLPDGSMGVVTGKGILQVSTLQVEGRNPMFSRDFLLGHQSFVGLILG